MPTVTITARFVPQLSPQLAQAAHKGLRYLPSGLTSTIHSFTTRQLSRGAPAEHAAQGKRSEPLPRAISPRNKDNSAAGAAPDCLIFSLLLLIRGHKYIILAPYSQEAFPLKRDFAKAPARISKTKCAEGKALPATRRSSLHWQN